MQQRKKDEEGPKKKTYWPSGENHEESYLYMKAKYKDTWQDECKWKTGFEQEMDDYVPRYSDKEEGLDQMSEFVLFLSLRFSGKLRGLFCSCSEASQQVKKLGKAAKKCNKKHVREVKKQTGKFWMQWLRPIPYWLFNVMKMQQVAVSNDSMMTLARSLRSFLCFEEAPIKLESQTTPESAKRN